MDPGQYGTISSLGQQPLSSKRSVPSFTWGHTDRLKDEYEKAKKVGVALQPKRLYRTCLFYDCHTRAHL